MGTDHSGPDIAENAKAYDHRRVSDPLQEQMKIVQSIHYMAN